MAQLALATTGAVIGSYFGPVGAQIGWTVGSLLGSSMGPSTQGPRLADLTVQVSSYGAPIAKIWGMMGVAGNVIWAAPLIESASSQGGKGGPSYTTYSYAGSFAVAIGEGELLGIRRIWLNAKLVYDVREDASQETAAASQDFSQYFVFYQGTEDQLPDPTIESYEGAGNVEAMRGTAYLVFTNLPLGNYANTIPQVHVETISEEPDVATTTDLQPLEIRAWEMGTSDGGYEHARHSGGGRTLFTAYDPVDGTIVLTSGEDYDTVVASVLALGYSTYCGMATGSQFQLDTFGQGTDLLSGLGPVQVWMNYFNHGISEVLWTGPNDNAVGNTAVCIYGQNPLDPSDILVSNIQLSYDDTGHAMSGVLTVLQAGATRAGYTTIAANCVFQYPPNFPPGFYPTAWIGHFASITAMRLPSVPVATCMPGDPHDLGIAELPADPNFCLSASGVLSPNVRYEQVTGSWLQLQVAEPAAPGPTSTLTLPGYGPVMLSSDPRNTMAFWVAAASDAGVSGSYGSSYPVPVTTAAQSVVTTASAANTPALLSDIVADICRTSGLDDLDFDVTELTDEVFGYARTKVMTGRAAIEPLRQAYAFDAVESGVQIIFRKRGAAPIATVTLDDLGAGLDVSTEPIEHHRDQETELPASVVITYPAFVSDYESGTQQARRISAISQQEMGVEMPVVLEDAAAADIAYTLLYDAWVGRNTRKVALTMKWAALEPTDVVVLNDGEFTYTVRVGDKSEQAGVNSLECKDSASLIYTDPAGSAGIVSGGGAVIRFVLPVNLMPLDIPIVRDIDDDGVGYYAAAGSFGNGTYPGTHLYRSADAGANYTFEKDLPAEAAIGIADTAIGDYAGGNTVDESSTVRVTIVSGSVSSITRDQLLAGGNLCVLGDEVMQFQRATLVSTGIYDLTGLLRGRFGTEWAMADHEDGEAFTVLTSTTVERILPPAVLLNVPLVLKGVAFGSTLDASYPIDFTNTGRGGKPLSPVHLGIGRLVNGSYYTQWVRRTRINGSWKDGLDVSLGETQELYRVRVLNGETVVEEQTVGEPMASLARAIGGASLTEGQFFLTPGLHGAEEVAGTAIGIREDIHLQNFNNHQVQQSIIQCNATGAIIKQSPPVGEYVTQVAHSSSAIYVLAYYATGGNAFGPLVNVIYKAEHSDVSAFATWRSDITESFSGVAFDGTDVWLADQTGFLYRCDADTLATVDTYTYSMDALPYPPLVDAIYRVFYAGSSLWVSTRFTNTLIEVDPATGSELNRIVCTDSIVDVFASSNVLFVLTPEDVLTFDRAGSPGLAQLDSVAVNLKNAAPSRCAVVFDLYLVVVDAPDVKLFNLATGEHVGNCSLWQTYGFFAYSLGGQINGELIITYSPTDSSFLQARSFALGEPSSITSYVGYILEVAQISDAVGVGYTETMIIP